MSAEKKLSKPTPAFIGASWVALLGGTIGYLVGIFNSSMELNEQGYYFTILLYGLFAAVSLQKSVRDREEGIAVTSIYFALCWFSLGAALILLVIGFWNATSLDPAEKGFYGMAFSLALFAAVAVQKNVRDLAMFKEEEKEDFYAQELPPMASDAAPFQEPR